MSRCFPYPRPGYVLPEKKQPLIESIKLQKEKEKAKEERRKERKREKKDKKRKCEVQSTPTLDKFGQEKLDEKSVKLEKQTSNLKGKYVKIQGDDVCSDLTNELNQPICVAKPSYSSEDSQNSDKRRRLELRTNTIQCSGSVLKIRLSSLNKKEDQSYSKKPNIAKDLPSTSGRTYPIDNLLLGQRLVKGHLSSAKTNVENRVEKQPILLETQKPNKDVTVAKTSLPRAEKKVENHVEKQPILLETQKPNKDVTVAKASLPRAEKKVENRVEKQPILLETQKPIKNVTVAKTSTSKGSKVESLYKSLLDLVPSALGGDQGCNDDDDGDWLFQKKFRKAEIAETIGKAPCSLDSNLWPRAQFLPSVDAYALPYTVPF